MLLLGDVIESYGAKGVGLPLGNLTSQLFANVYMNIFDQFVKHKLKIKHYIRYADDFVFLSHNREYLVNLLPAVRYFLKTELKLALHPDKVFLKTFASGVDYLGWVNFPTHRVLRRSTEKRIFLRLKENPEQETVQSYLGLLRHGDTRKIQERLLMEYWIYQEDGCLFTG
ncbi:MAG: RNA-directed DNA polymerase [bacterium]